MAKAKPLPTLTAIDATRFWFHVKRGKANECWPWQLSSNNGYGQFQVGGRPVRAHRVAYYLGHGADPGEYLVCHACDTPVCCNPSHLFLGTAGDNATDRNQKGRNNPPSGWRSGRYTHPERTARGERAGGAKLTDEQVVEIRALYASGLTQQDVGDRFGIKRETVGAIIRGKNWQHIAAVDERVSLSDPKRHGSIGTRNASAKLTEDNVREIRRLRQDSHVSVSQIAKQFGVTEKVIYDIMRGKIWKHVH